MARPTADDLIVHFLTYVHQAQGSYIERYMVRQWAYAPGSIRNALGRLVKVGRIERIGYGRYRVTSAGQAEHKAGALATHYHG